MTSTSESTKPSPRVETAAVVTHGQVDVKSGVERLRNVAKRSGVTLVDDARDADLTIVLGGDGTMLRTLARLLGSEVPVLGVNYGRVGFLASIPPADLERDLERAFAGEYVTVPLPTLQVRLDGERYIAVNDVVVTSSTLGKMIELAWAIGGEDLGVEALLVPYLIQEIEKGKAQRRPGTPVGAGDTRPGTPSSPAPGQPDGQPDPYSPRAARR